MKDMTACVAPSETQTYTYTDSQCAALSPKGVTEAPDIAEGMDRLWQSGQDLSFYSFIVVFAAVCLAWRAVRRRSAKGDGEPVFAVILG